MDGMAKKSAAEQLADEAARRAFNGIEARQVISEHISTPEFHANLARGLPDSDVALAEPHKNHRGVWRIKFAERATINGY
jgi:hypothetical protein